MKLRVLGCSGGIGGNLSTTSFLLNDDILLDCGTGIGNLSLAEMKKIRAIFFTHSHLDHIAGLPLLVDSIFDSLQDHALQVYGSKETISALKTHVFNNIIWPDFTLIPTEDSAVLNFNVLDTGKQYHQEGCTLEMIPVNHVVPTVGYRIECEHGSLAFSADTTTNDSFWARLNEYQSLDYLLVECAFSNNEMEICRLARHYCPEMLGADINKLKHKPVVYISHLKPGSEDVIMSECKQAIQGFEMHRLMGDQIIDI
jgi:ribonuclease BN (tRNA processing enzyme)